MANGAPILLGYICGPIPDIWQKTDRETRAANLLKAELKRKGVTYSQPVEKLFELGVDEKEVNVRNKLSRGKFTAAFLIQCLEAIGSQQLRLN